MKIFFFKSSVKVYQSDTFCYYNCFPSHIKFTNEKNDFETEVNSFILQNGIQDKKNLPVHNIYSCVSLFFSSSRHQYLFLFFLSIFCKIYSQYTDPVQKCATSSVARFVLLRFLNGTVSFVNGIVSFVRGTIWFLHGTVRIV